MTNRLLFVCLGNICRSPAAEAVFLHKVDNKGLSDQFLVDSAGTGGWHVGNQADQRMRQAALKRGIEIKSRARQIKRDDFNKFNLILTMDNSNLADVKSLYNDITIETNCLIYPILSFATSTDIVEVPDPYYGGESGFDYVLDLLEDATEGLLKKLLESG